MINDQIDEYADAKAELDMRRYEASREACVVRGAEAEARRVAAVALRLRALPDNATPLQIERATWTGLEVAAIENRLSADVAFTSARAEETAAMAKVIAIVDAIRTKDVQP